MRSLSLVGAVVLISLGSGLAWAQTAPSAPNTSSAVTVPPAKPAKDPDEVICVRQEEIGSRVPGPKECHTRRQWDQMSQDARDNAQDLQMRRQMGAQQKGG
jgi:hypothetical protein